MPRKVVVEIGGIPISLSATHPAFFELLIQRYTGFLSASPSDIELVFDIVEDASVSDDDIRVCRNGEEWHIDRGDFSARWNPRSRVGFVRQNPNPYSLDSVLRILHSLFLAERGGFLLHAASAIWDGRAYLFSGVSGAGKTTMMRLAPPGITLLTDEISYIRPRVAEHLAFGTPFAGELAKPGENTSAPVSALFFLEKGPENLIENISSAEAVRRLMRNILFFAEDPTLVENLLATACDFVARVPIYCLTFYPDSKVWDQVRHFARGFDRSNFMSDSLKEGLPAHV